MRTGGSLVTTKPSASTARKPTRKKTPYMVVDLCFVCGQCDDVCPFDGIVEGLSPAGFPMKFIDPVLCRGCRKCADACPIGAIIEGEQPGFG